MDWTHQIRNLVDVEYPHAECITLVMDKLEIHYTPKQGSWLNMAEIELSILSRQCLDRRIPDQETLKKEIAAWQGKRNAIAQPMEWRFTNEDARVKLKKLYPTIQK